MAYLFWGLVDRSSTTHMWSLQLRKDEEKEKVTLIQNLGGGKMHLDRSDFHIPTGFWGGSMVCHGFPGFPNLLKYQSWDLLIRWVFMDSSIRNSWENHQLGKWWVSPRRNMRRSLKTDLRPLNLPWWACFPQSQAQQVRNLAADRW